MKTLIDNLVKEAYDIFSIYEMGEEVEVCTQCCVPKKYQDILLSTPLRELSVKAIYEYLDAAACYITEEGAINQIRYLLPRILELFVADEELRCLVDYTLDKLRCNDKHWKSHEIDFMTRFAESYFKYLIDDDLEVDLACFIVVFDLAELDVSDRLLQIWQENASKKNAFEAYIYLMDYEMSRETNKYTNPTATNELKDKIGKWAIAQLDNFLQFEQGNINDPNTKVSRHFYNVNR